MKYRFAIITLIIIGLFSFVSASENIILDEQIKETITNYYVKLFSSNVENVQITFLRLPNYQLDLNKKVSIQVSDSRNKKKLGYQTIWVKILSDGKLVKKSPVSVYVEVRCEIVRASQKIKRKANVIPSMLTTEECYIDSDLGSVINNPDQVLGLAAQRMIKPGEILTKDLFDQPAVVQRGERLKLEIHTNNIIVTTECIAKADGIIGDKINVITEPSGKRILATIKNHGLAIVQQEN